MKIQLLLFLLFNLVQLNRCFIFESYLGYTAAIGFSAIAYKYRCNFVECCEIFNKETLKSRLQGKLNHYLYGQPIANTVIPGNFSLS